MISGLLSLGLSSGSLLLAQRPLGILSPPQPPPLSVPLLSLYSLKNKEIFLKIIEDFEYGQYQQNKPHKQKLGVLPYLKGVLRLKGLRITGLGHFRCCMNHLHPWGPQLLTAVNTSPPRPSSVFSRIPGPGKVRAEAPSVCFPTGVVSGCTRVPTATTPHPGIQTRPPVPTHVEAPLPHYQTHARHPGLPRSPSGPPQRQPRGPPTCQAGGGVDPLEQLAGAQLAALVGVRGLDGLAHAHLAGRRARHSGEPRASGRVGQRGARARSAGRRRRSPGPHPRAALAARARPLHWDVGFEVPRISRGARKRTLFGLRSQMRGHRGWQSWTQPESRTCRGRTAVLRSEDCGEN